MVHEKNVQNVIMERLKKRIYSIKDKRLLMILVGMLGMTMLIILGQTYGDNVKEDNFAPNVIPAQIEVPTMETDPALSLGAVEESFPISSVPIPETIPAGKIYPRPADIPSLREYEINKDDATEIWYARNPESYIIPQNEWVKYVASQLYFDQYGRIRYKNMPVPSSQGYNGNIISWTDEPFFNSYISDDKLFNFPANGDLWQNADYYLSHGLRGDCEDWAIATTSMMLSGEMSIKENGNYVRQVIPAKAVIGYSGKSKDIWVEYGINGNRYISSTGTEFNPGTGKDEPITTFHLKSEWSNNFEPIYQFTNKNFGKYKNDG